MKRRDLQLKVYLSAKEWACHSARSEQAGELSGEEDNEVQ